MVPADEFVARRSRQLPPRNVCWPGKNNGGPRNRLATAAAAMKSCNPLFSLLKRKIQSAADGKNKLLWITDGAASAVIIARIHIGVLLAKKAAPLSLALCSGSARGFLAPGSWMPSAIMIHTSLSTRRHANAGLTGDNYSDRFEELECLVSLSNAAGGFRVSRNAKQKIQHKRKRW